MYDYSSQPSMGAITLYSNAMHELNTRNMDKRVKPEMPIQKMKFGMRPNSAAILRRFKEER